MANVFSDTVILLNPRGCAGVSARARYAHVSVPGLKLSRAAFM